MAMQIVKDTFMPYGRSQAIYGCYQHSKTDCAAKVKDKQAPERVEKTKDEERAAEVKKSDRLSKPQDEYIRGEQSGKKLTGLYRVGQDENGNRKIFFDDLKADEDRSTEDADGKAPKADENNQEEPVERCVGNTDKVEREIKKLKEKKQELKRQIQSLAEAETSLGHFTAPSGNQTEKKVRELEKKLAQVEQELRQKDNDAYRRQHTVFSRMN